MKFSLIDSILELERGERIVAAKAVSLSEDYLADHFPAFPILPGVFMLQALVEAASWLVRDALDFAPGVILLQNARNVTYKSLVKPGSLLRLDVHCRRLAPGESDFEGVGHCGSTEAVKGRFGLTHLGPGAGGGPLVNLNDRTATEAKARFTLLIANGRGGAGRT